jgi:hypothetical protein
VSPKISGVITTSAIRILITKTAAITKPLMDLDHGASLFLNLTTSKTTAIIENKNIMFLVPAAIAAKKIAHNHQAPECKKRRSVKDNGLCHLRGADGIRALFDGNLVISFAHF